MRGQWMILLLLTGFSYVSGNNCDTAHVETTYEQLLNYETKDFPFYGENEAKLEETCDNINNSFDFIKSYIKTCSKNPECDDTCRELSHEMNTFISKGGVMNLAHDLCEEGSDNRQKYLDSYECLVKYSDTYSACFNKSEVSKQYIATIGAQDRVAANCCYFSWLHGCYINITREHCGKEAAEFVTVGLQTIVEPIISQMCAESEITCSNPPLPPGEDDQEGSYGNKNDKDGTSEEKKGEKDNDEPDENEEGGDRTSGEKKNVKNNDEPEENKENEDERSKEKKSENSDGKPDEKVQDLNNVNKDKHGIGSATILSCSSAGTMVVVAFLLLVNFLIY